MIEMKEIVTTREVVSKDAERVSVRFVIFSPQFTASPETLQLIDLSHRSYNHNKFLHTTACLLNLLPVSYLRTDILKPRTAPLQSRHHGSSRTIKVRLIDTTTTLHRNKPESTGHGRYRTRVEL